MLKLFAYHFSGDIEPQEAVYIVVGEDPSDGGAKVLDKFSLALLSGGKVIKSSIAKQLLKCGRRANCAAICIMLSNNMSKGCDDN